MAISKGAQSTPDKSEWRGNTGFSFFLGRPAGSVSSCHPSLAPPYQVISHAKNSVTMSNYQRKCCWVLIIAGFILHHISPKKIAHVIVLSAGDAFSFLRGKQHHSIIRYQQNTDLIVIYIYTTPCQASSITKTEYESCEHYSKHHDQLFRVYSSIVVVV